MAKLINSASIELKTNLVFPLKLSYENNLIGLMTNTSRLETFCTCTCFGFAFRVPEQSIASVARVISSRIVCTIAVACYET